MSFNFKERFEARRKHDNLSLSSPNVLREQRRSYLQDPCLKDFTDSSDIIKKVSSPIGFRIIFLYNL